MQVCSFILLPHALTHPRQPLRRLCSSRPRARRLHHAPFRASLDPYKELGVSPTADSATIKRAYRKAALERHPDVSGAPNARESFQRAQDAYRMLSDPSSRAAYDRAARRSTSGTYSGSSSNFSGDGGAAAREYARKWRQENPMPEDLDDDLGSVLRDLFGGAMRGAKEKGPSVLNDVLDLLERNVGIGGSGSANGGVNNGQESEENSVLNCKSEDVLEAEIRECARAIETAEVRVRGTETETETLHARKKGWERRAVNAVDYGARIGAQEMIREIEAQLGRLETRVSKFREVERAAREHRRLLSERLEQVRRGEVKVDRPKARTERTQEKSRKQGVTVDEELEAMKRELGL